MILGFLVVLKDRLETFVYCDFVVVFPDFSEARVCLEPRKTWIGHWRGAKEKMIRHSN